MCGPSRRRRGASLLEAIVALSVLAVAGVALLGVVDASARAVSAAQSTDDDIARASAFLYAVSLWPTADLDRRLGDRQQGHWRLYIESSGSLYSIVLFDSTGRRRLLETAVHRPLPTGPSNAAP